MQSSLRSCLAFVCLTLGTISQAQAAVTFTVNTTDDTLDGTCDIAHCSLDDAITQANLAAGTDTIAFNILPAGSTHVTV